MKHKKIFFSLIISFFLMENSLYSSHPFRGISRAAEQLAQAADEISWHTKGYGILESQIIDSQATSIKAIEELIKLDGEALDKLKKKDCCGQWNYHDGYCPSDYDANKIRILRLNYLDGKLKELREQEQEEADERLNAMEDAKAAREVNKIIKENEGKIQAAVQATKQFIESLCSTRGVSAFSACVFSLVGIKFGFTYLKDALNKPTLAIKSSIPSASQRVHSLIFGSGKEEKTNLDDIIFEPKLAQYMETLTQSYLNAISHGAPLRNVLFYGPPGTGKTAIAKTIASFIDERCNDGMDYIYFAASNLDQFPIDEAIKAINDLFTYAQHSSKKLMIIIDECEVLFANRASNLSEQARKMLTAFLTFTGQPSHDFVIIGLTNRRDDLDTAWKNRFYEQVYVGAPEQAERARILEKYFNDYLVRAKNLAPHKLTFLQRLMGKKIKPVDKIIIDPKVLEQSTIDWLCSQIEGFVGRDIENLIIAMQAEAYASNDNTLTEQMVRDITMRKVSQRAAQAA